MTSVTTLGNQSKDKTNHPNRHYTLSANNQKAFGERVEKCTNQNTNYQNQQ
jgi:hypothetical protein